MGLKQTSDRLALRGNRGDDRDQSLLHPCRASSYRVSPEPSEFLKNLSDTSRMVAHTPPALTLSLSAPPLPSLLLLLSHIW